MDAVIEEEKKKKRAGLGAPPDPNANQTAMYVAGAQAKAAADAANAPPDAPAPAPIAAAPSPGGFNIDPARGITPGSADGGPMPGSRAVMQGFGQDASENINKGRYGALVGDTARATAAMVPAVISDVVSPAVNALAPVGQGIANAVKTFATGDSTPFSMGRPPATPATPVAPAAKAVTAPVATNPAVAVPAPAAPAPANVVTDNQRNIIPQPATGQSIAPTSVPGVTRIDRPGQSPTFTNISADDPSNQALAARGSPSVQMQNAAVATTAPGGAPLAHDARGFEPAVIRHSGNDWRAANNLRNLEVSASSITNRTGGRNGASPAILAYQEALKTDGALQRGDNPDVISRNRDGAYMDRTQALEDGALKRTAMQEAGSTTRLGMTNRIAQQKADAEGVKLGFESRAAKRMADAADAIANAKTPEEHKKATERMLALQGKGTPANRFTVVPNGQGIDSKTGLAYTLPSDVIDNQTGQLVPQGSRKTATQSQRPVGTVSDVGGKKAVWDGSKWIPQ